MLKKTKKLGFIPENLDIMGRSQCSSIMPCGICRIFNKMLDCFPKGMDYGYDKVIKFE